VSDFITAQFTGQPALVALDGAAQFNALVSHLSANTDFARLVEARASMTDDFWDCDEWDAQFRPYEVNSDGILFVPVRGVLLHNFPYALGNWATGYEYVQRAVLRGLDDANVKGIALLCNSPGGMVAGCFEAVDKIYERRDEKPIRAFAHEYAYSAAYAVASVASAGIVVSKTGGVGSIGVVTSHVDLSKMYDEAGIKVTFIFAGKHKVEGNATEPLAADVKERIQVRIDELYDVFVSNVARNRGMEEKVIRDTEALTYTASQAVSIGLADSIGPLDDAVAQFCADLSTPSGEETMSNQTDAAVVDQAAHEQAIATATATGVAQGEANATARIGAILGSEEAKGRGDLANHFAFKTTMSAEDAVAALAVSPKAAAPVAADAVEGGFDAAMSQGNPNVGASATGSETEADVAAETLALAKQLGLGFAK
jgi:signal peptide peptidase SppA